jgi:hypothetical protein
LINRPQSRAGFRSHETFIIPAAQEIIGPLTSHTFSRNRRGQLLRGRVPGLIMGSRMAPMLPPSAVPESLIESVQTVLQSKSRNVIIRELQRTVRVRFVKLSDFLNFICFIEFRCKFSC